MEFLPSTMFNPMSLVDKTNWTKTENKLFEIALAHYDTNTPDRWFKVAARVPGKSAYDVMIKYEELLADMYKILPNLAPPGYRNCVNSNNVQQSKYIGCKRPLQLPVSEPERSTLSANKKPRKMNEKFLPGMETHGGAWRNICRDFLRHKTPKELGSHAQKYLGILRKGIANGEMATSPAQARPAILDFVCLTTASCLPNSELTQQAAYLTAPQTALLDKPQPPILATMSIHPNSGSYRAAHFAAPPTVLLDKPQPPSLEALSADTSLESYEATNCTTMQTPMSPQLPVKFNETSLNQQLTCDQQLQTPYHQAASLTTQPTLLTSQPPSTTDAIPFKDDFSALSTKPAVSSPVSAIEWKTEEQVNLMDVTTNVDTGKGRDEPQVDILDDSASTCMDLSTHQQLAETDKLGDPEFDGQGEDFVSWIDSDILIDDGDDDDGHFGLHIPMDNLEDIDFVHLHTR